MIETKHSPYRNHLSFPSLFPHTLLPPPSLPLSPSPQLLAYFTPTDTINVDQFIRMVVARSDGHDPKIISALFASLFGPDPAYRATFEETCSRFGEAYPEVNEGLLMYLPAYCGDDACFGLAEFGLLHSDMYACSAGAVDFGSILDGLWIRGN